MHLSRLRFPVLATLLVLAASCVDGDATGADGEGIDTPMGIALSPVFPVGAALQQDAPISRIRVTVLLQPAGTQLSVQTIDVDPNQSAWDISVDFQIPSGGTTTVDLLLELLSVTNGVETTEWSGFSGPLTVTGSGSTEVQDVPVGRGPPTNLSVTGIDATPESSQLAEGSTLQLDASVQVSDPTVTPVVAWSSSDTGIATVDSNGLVTGILPGNAVITAAAGEFTDQVTVEVLAVPAGVRVTPEQQLVQRLPAEVEFQAEVIDQRGQAIPGQAVAWSTDTQGVLRFLDGSRFRVIGEGQGRAVATSVSNGNLSGVGIVNVELIDADVRLSSQLSTSTILPGRQFQMEILVENLGPATASEVVVTLFEDEGLGLLSLVPSEGSTDRAARRWTVGDLPRGAVETLRLTFLVSSEVKNVELSAGGSVAAAASSPDPDPSNNTTRSTISVGQILPNLDVVAGASVSKAAPSETEEVVFSTTFTNTGSDPVNSVVASVAIDPGLTRTGHSASQGTYDPALGTWAIGTLAPGATATLDLNTVVQSGRAGQELGVTAEMTGFSDAVDTDPANDRARATVTPVGADVEISKTVNRTSQVEGLEAVFTVTARNVGATRVSNVQVQDALPDGMTLASSTPSSGSFTSGVWTIPSIEPGGSETLQLRVTLARGTAGRTLTNTARLQGLLQTDTNPSNDAASASIRVDERRANVSVGTSVSRARPAPGETIEVPVVVSNSGPQTAEGVEVQITLDEPLRVEDVRLPRGSWTDGTTTWGLGDLASGESATLTLLIVVPEGKADIELGIVAEAKLGSGVDPDPSDNRSRTSFTPASGDVAITKSVSRTSPVAGDTVTFKVVARNNGSTAVTNVAVGDTLPAGMSIQDVATTSGSYEHGVWTLPTVEAGTADTLTIIAVIASDRGGQTLTNRATLLRLDQDDSNADNNRGEASVTPSVPQADLAITVGEYDSTPNEGEVVSVPFTVTNLGPWPADAIQISVAADEGLGEGTPTPSQGSWDSSTGIWDLGSLSPQGSATFSLPVEIESGTSELELDAVLSVQSQANSGDPVARNDEVVAAFTIEALALDRTFATLGQTELVVGDHAAISSYPVEDEGPGLLNDYSTAELDEGSVGTFVTGSGAEVSIDEDGSFRYLPPTGLSLTTDEFSYTYEGGTTATVTIELGAPVFWLDGNFDEVDGARPGGAAPQSIESLPSTYGTSWDPFTSASDVVSYTSTGDAIAVVAGPAPYGPLTVQSDQTIYGEGTGLAPEEFGTVMPPGDYPVFESTPSAPAIRVNSRVTLFGIEGQAVISGDSPAAFSAVENSDGSYHALRLGGDSDRLVEIAYGSGALLFDGLVVDDAFGSFDVLGGSQSITVTVASWTQATDGLWAIDIDGTSGEIDFAGNRLQLAGGGIRITNATGAIGISNEVLLNASSGTALYLEDNSGEISIDLFDATTTSEDGGIYMDDNTGLVSMPSTRFDGEEYATIDVDDTALSATFTRLHYSADGDGFAGHALDFTSLYERSALTFEDLDVTAYGGNALYVSGYAPELGVDPDEGAAIIELPKVPVSIPDPGLANLRTVGGYGYSGTALRLSRVDMDIDLGTLETDDAYSGLYLYNTTGELDVADAHIEGTGAAAVYISSGDPDVDLNIRSSTIRNEDDYAVEIKYTSGASIVFNGGSIIDDGGDGIRLFGNFGSSIKFNTTLDLQPQSYSVGFDASNGGTVEVLGSSNSISTMYSEAVILDGVTIGPGGMTFGNVSVTGDDYGYPGYGMIFADLTPGGGTFMVQPTTSGSGAGGIFSGFENSTSVHLDNAHDIHLEYMTLEGAPAISAINGSSDLSLIEVDVNYEGYPGGTNSTFYGMTGDLIIEDSYFYDGENVVDVLGPTSGSLDVAVRNSTFQDASGETGTAFLINTTGTGTVNSYFENATFRTSEYGIIGSAAATSTLQVIVESSDFDQLDSGGIVLEDVSAANLHFDVRNSDFTSIGFAGIEFWGAGGSLEGRILDNDISSTGYGIRGIGDSSLGADFTGTGKVHIQRNSISSTDDGLVLSTEGPSAPSGTVYANILANTIGTSSSGIELTNAGTATMCLNVAANDADGNGEDPGIGFDFDSGTTRIERLGGGSGAEWAPSTIDALFTSENPDSDDVSGSGTADGVAHGTCTGPSLPSGLGNVPPVMIPQSFSYLINTGIKSGLEVYATDLDDASLTFIRGALTGPGSPDDAAVTNVVSGAKSVTFDFDSSLNPTGSYTFSVTAQDAIGSVGVAVMSILLSLGAG